MINALKTHRTAVACAFVALGLISGIAGFQAFAKVADTTVVHADVEHFSASSSRIALVVANADYPDADAPLARSTIEDASALAASLRSRGFDVDFETNVTKQAMDHAVDAFVAKARPGVTALVSFSGFGIQLDHVNYLIPTDAGIWKAQDVKRDGVSLGALLSRIGAKGADRTIAILDASRRNPFERRFRPVSAGLATIEPPRETLVLSTTIPGRTSDEMEAQTRPVLTLSDAMRTSATDAETLFDHAKHRISLASKGRQVPTVSSALGSSFSF